MRYAIIDANILANATLAADTTETSAAAAATGGSRRQLQRAAGNERAKYCQLGS